MSGILLGVLLILFEILKTDLQGWRDRPVWETWKLRQWHVGECSLTGSWGEKALICSIYQFSRCIYSYLGWFQIISITARKVELRRDSTPSDTTDINKLRNIVRVNYNQMIRNQSVAWNWWVAFITSLKNLLKNSWFSMLGYFLVSSKAYI